MVGIRSLGVVVTAWVAGFASCEKAFLDKFRRMMCGQVKRYARNGCRDDDMFELCCLLESCPREPVFEDIWKRETVKLLTATIAKCSPQGHSGER